MRSIAITSILIAGFIALVPTASASGGAAVTSRTTGLGPAITTSSGHTLYLFRGDHGATSACYGACATFWPPLLTTGKPVASGKVKSALLGTTKRKDGKLQVTYKGHPLYTFLLDKRAGQTAGEGSKEFGASWYAIAPSGATIDRD
jgi:predicted lipoprotein with Yx(FWY)xxD motif